MAEDSGTAAPDPRSHDYADDPRSELVADALMDSGHSVCNSDTPLYTTVDLILADADAADRAAGVIRVRTDDATVEKVAQVVHKRDGYRLHEWDDSSDYAKDRARETARAVLEALVTP